MKAPMIIWCVAAHLAVVGAAHAQDQPKNSWVGKRVFTQFGAAPRVENKVGDAKGRDAGLNSSGKGRRGSRVYRVEQTKGDWLWLQDENSGLRGWVESRLVVPYDQAIDFYTDQIRANPQASLYNWRGNIWLERGEYDKAIADFNEATRRDPKDANALSNRGLAWEGKQEHDKAIADFNEAIRLDPSDASAYNNRGDAWSEKKEYVKAIADFNEAIRLDPRDASAYGNRGNALYVTKEYVKAIADYDAAIRLDPRLGPAYHNRGLARYETKEYVKAIADYDEAIRLDPRLGPAYRDRGNARYVTREYDKAVADYSEAARLDPRDASAFSFRAWIWATCPVDKVRDGKKAVDSATKACELTGWKSPGDLDTLAAAYAASGALDKAVEWQEKAINLSSVADKKARQTRLDLYRQKKPYRAE